MDRIKNIMTLENLWLKDSFFTGKRSGDWTSYYKNRKVEVGKIKTSNENMEYEANRVLNLLPNIQPVIQRAVPVVVPLSIPIVFQIQ